MNSSLYDIRESFKGRTEGGRMNTYASDTTFNELDAKLREALLVLASIIEPKIFEYEFLLQ